MPFDNAQRPGPGRGTGERAINLPPAVLWLIGINVAVHLLRTVLGDEADWAMQFGLIPANYTGGGHDLAAQVLAPITYQFLHGGWMHLGINMVMLAAFAEAARLLGRDDYRRVAVANGNFILSSLRAGDGSLLRSWRKGRARLNAYLEDYADVADGRDHQQQEHPGRVHPGGRTAQEVRVDLGEQQHRHGADRKSRSGAVDGGHALPRGAVQHDQPVGGDQREPDHQRAVDLQREQHACRPGEGAARA